MKKTYSKDEALVSVLEILDAVTAGETITVTDGGVPFAEIRPTLPHPPRSGPGSDQKMQLHLEELRSRGVLKTGYGTRGDFRAVARVPGALDRFLKERD